MLRRLLLGLVIGLVVGGAVAAGLARLIGLSFAVPGGVFFALAAAAITGGLTGLLAGKPFWAEGAKVEASLKAFFGALLGAGAMLGLRRWGVEVAAPAWLGGTAPIGDLTEVALPLVAAALGMLFGLDNVPDAQSSASAPGMRKRVASGPQMKRVAGDDVAVDDGGAEADRRRAPR